ncbi:CDP-glycerol glycerophosphotransferase family protein [Arthrobacter woluwensis]|uniref:CDP-glycerol glycerophosphotransferase family protein n=1 Tax=Arthrobacter woluwensis TaxID=156980 RepID=UPI0037FE0EF1
MSPKRLRTGISAKLIHVARDPRAAGLVKNLPRSNASARFLFRLGREAMLRDDTRNAETYLRRAVDLCPENAGWRYTLGLVQERLGRLEEAEQSYGKAIELGDCSKYRHHRAGALIAMGRLHDGLAELQHVCSSADPDPRSYSRLLNGILHGSMSSNERLRHLRHGVEAGIARDDWILELARAAFAQRLDDEALEWYGIFAKGNRLAPADAYCRGVLLHNAGSMQAARREFEIAVGALSHKERRFGLGALHASKGNWALAKSQFLVEDADVNAGELYFRTGMAHDRTYDWAGAETYYTLAITEDPSQGYWRWRLGFAMERQEKFEAAAQYYAESSAILGADDQQGLYDAGRMLVAAGRIPEALYCFQRQYNVEFVAMGTEDAFYRHGQQLVSAVGPETSHAVTPRTAQLAKTAGMELVREREFSHAVPLLEKAARGLRRHDPQVFHALGYANQMLGREQQAVAHYLRMRAIQAPDGVGRSIKLSPEEELRTRYLAYQDELPLARSTILYEVGHGSSVSCNPLALYRAARRQEDYNDFNHVWVVQRTTTIPDDVLQDEAVTIVERETDNYYRHLATAGFLVNNTSFGSYFIRRHGQRYLNTWHGTPLKTLGKSVRGESWNYGNIARNLLHTTHLSTGNAWTARKLLESNNADALFSGRILASGSPRIDALLNTGEAVEDMLRDRLRVGSDKPFVVYAPTWRGSLGESGQIEFDPTSEIRILKSIEAAGFHVRFSAHRFVHELAQNDSLAEWLIPKDLDLYEILAFADALVTDYSSVYFDFLARRKSIVFYAPDLEDYAEERGFYDVPMTGPICRDIESVVAELVKAKARLFELESEWEAARENFAGREDGDASRRVLDWFVRGCESEHEFGVDRRGSSLVFRQSLIPNGIAASLRALSRELVDKTEMDIHVVIDRASVVRDPERVEQGMLLPDEVRVLPRVGATLFTAEERWLDLKDRDPWVELTSAQQEILDRAFSREFRRILGDATPHLACEFDGYTRFWVRVFGAAQAARVRAAYLHSNMFEERKSKHPQLASVFPLYRQFDALISVSDSVNYVNRKNLSKQFGVDESDFVSANNVIDTGRIAQAASETLSSEITEFARSAQHLLVAVGRLSYEKGHDRLIRRYAEVRPHGLRVVVVGGGPEEKSLEALISRLGLEDDIMLTGHLDNPYPIMARASAVTLLSRWEGQGLSLLEALVLKKKIIATDIPGPQSIVQAFGGLLVPNDENGVDQALASVVHERVPDSSFNVENYNAEALARFMKCVSLPDQRFSDRS